MNIIPCYPSTSLTDRHIIFCMKTAGWRERFTSALAKAKREQGMTQEKLAEQLNVYQGNISKWKKGGSTPPLEMFELIAEALKVPLEWLLFGDVMRLSEDERHLLEDYRENPNQNKDALRTIARSGRLVPDTKDQASGQQ